MWTWMADKDFKVKNKLQVKGITSAGPVVSDSSGNLDSTPYIATQYGGTGTTTSPSAGQILYSTSGTTYAPTTLSSLVYAAPTIGSTQITSGGTFTTLPGVTSINGATVPTSGTLSTLAGTESLSSKTLNQTSSATINTNNATAVDTVSLASFTTLKYVLSIKQGSKIRSSELIIQTDGSSVDFAEYAVIETGGIMNAISVVPAVSSTNCVINITIANAAATNATVKLFKVLM